MARPFLNGTNGLEGGASQPAAGDGTVLRKMHDALQIVHNPYSSNDARQSAQGYLEIVKVHAEAPSHGFTLAADRSQSPIIRHYGLSLLEHAVRHKWAEYSPEQAEYLRKWVLQLAEGVSRDDAAYLRAKVAQLWVEIAKRCWGADWWDLDELLVKLWQVPESPIHKELVLQILATLADEVFSSDDAAVAVREGLLSRACIVIFSAEPVLKEIYGERTNLQDFRCGAEGWLSRISQFLHDCLDGDVQNNDAVRACALRALDVFYFYLPYSLPKTLISTSCIPVICRGLAVPHMAVQKASLEAFHAFYSRAHFSDDEFGQLVVPLFDDDFVGLCRRLFEWSKVDAQDIDDDKYMFAKKFAELLACLGKEAVRRYSLWSGQGAPLALLELFLLVAQSDSLVVSIPILVTWTQVLNHTSLGPAAAETPLIASLLELCTSRSIRYEQLPDDTQDPSYVLLIEDTDTIPERHAFLGNYRRFSAQIIEAIVQLKPSDAFYHILEETEKALKTVCVGQPPLDAAKYTKSSMSFLQVDAHFTVIESALRGFVKWRSDTASLHSAAEKHKKEQISQALQAHFETWCLRLLDLQVEDPLIRKRILQLLVAFSTLALDKNTGFMLKVLEHILMTWPATQPEHRNLNEAIKDLQSESVLELQRLAAKMPDHLLDVYDQIEAKVREMIASGTLDEKRQIGYQSFLFIIIHRTARLEEATRARRLQAFVDPIEAQWNDQGLKQTLASYDGFCQLLALDKAQRYLAQHRVHEVKAWGSAELDAEGLALQEELEQRLAMLPIRSTKSYLTYSVEKVERNSPQHRASRALWKGGLPVILPELLQMLAYAHASHTAKNWTYLPTEMQSIVGQVLTDRFWQAGISEGSKDDFYARVLNKRNTLEGLASSIRGSVRFVRETAYAIIYCMSRLDLEFYGFSELPGPLAKALFADSSSLSSHQLINLLNLVRYLVDHCPIALRDHFLPPLLAACFQQMDAKIGAEWAALGQQEDVRAAAEELTEEMKAESILRQLTYTAVIMVADILDPSRTDLPPDTVNDTSQGAYPTLRKFCLSNVNIAVPLLLFCKNAILMHDGRCCGVVLRVFRSIIPELQGTDASKAAKDVQTTLAKNAFPIPEETAREIREFIATDVFKAAIQALHDPYFVENQREIGTLIACILGNYSALTSAPRDILLQLPDMKPQKVDYTIQFVSQPGIPHRQQRAVVLDLLKHLKGVSVAEMGRLTKSASVLKGSLAQKKTLRSKMAQEFMMAGGDANDSAGRKSPDLEGVAGMFNEGK